MEEATHWVAFFVFWAGGDYWENANSLLAEGAGAGLVQDIQLGGFVEFVKAEAAPPHSKAGVGRLKVAATRGELTALWGNLIFKDYLVGIGRALWWCAGIAFCWTQQGGLKQPLRGRKLRT